MAFEKLIKSGGYRQGELPRGEPAAGRVEFRIRMPGRSAEGRLVFDCGAILGFDDKDEIKDRQIQNPGF